MESRPSLSLVLILSLSVAFALSQSLTQSCSICSISQIGSLTLFLLFLGLSGKPISQSLLFAGTLSFSLQISFLCSSGFIEEVAISSDQRRDLS